MEMNQLQKFTTSEVIKEAFHFWSKTIWYQILFSLLTFSFLFITLYFFAARLGILEQYLLLSEKLKKGIEAYKQGVQEMTQDPAFFKFQLAIILSLSFLFPMNLGLLKMFRKIDLGEKIVLQDLFSGYSGVNFFIYFGYFLFWFTVYSYALSTIFLGIIWVFITLFSAPLMFFANKRIFDTFSLNIRAFRLFPFQIFAAVVFSVLFKYAGIFSLVGGIFTYPFWNAMIYALYKRIFLGEEKIQEN